MPVTDVALDWAENAAATWAFREYRARRRFPASITSTTYDRIVCHTHDLSCQGVGLVGPSVLPEGSSVSVVLKLGGADTMAMDGTIRWASAGRMGVRLQTLDRRVLMLLASADVQNASDVRGGRVVELAPLPPYPRLPRYREELVGILNTGGIVCTRVTVTDVSARGLGVCARQLPAVGKDVHLEITLPDGSEAQVAGKVAWVQPADERVPLMTAGIALSYADEDFYRFILERDGASDQPSSEVI